MPSIQRLQSDLTFFYANGRQHRNHRVCSARGKHSRLFPLIKHPHKRFMVLDALLPLYSLTARRITTLPTNGDNLPQNMTFHTSKSRCCKRKMSYVSKGFVYPMYKIGSRRFGCLTVDQHLLLKPSFEKQWEYCCARNILI